MIFALTTLLAQNPTVPQTPATIQPVETSGIIPTCATQVGGADTLDCFLQLFINIADILLGVVGVVLLAVLVWGGLIYLTSAGEADKVKKATQMFLGSFVGLLIVFGAFAAVTFGVQFLTGQGVGGDQAIPAYFTCGTPVLRDGRGVPIDEGNPQNEDKSCGPNAKCHLGVCVEQATLQSDESNIIIETAPL